MRGSRELGHVATGLGDDDLRNPWTDTGDGLQQLDLVGPRLTRRLDDSVEFGHRLLDPVQPVQDRSGQLRMMEVEVAL